MDLNALFCTLSNTDSKYVENSLYFSCGTIQSHQIYALYKINSEGQSNNSESNNSAVPSVYDMN